MDTPAPGTDPVVPRPLFSVEPPPPRRFAWGTFFLGVGAGVLTTVLLLAAGITAIVIIANRIVANDAANSESMLSPPILPEHGRPLSVYGDAEATWTVYTLSGAPAKLSDYRGKVVFVNFWATWCGPCVMEMPSIQHLQDKMKDAPVVFLLVSDEDAGTIEKFLKTKPWTMQSFRGDGNPPTVFHTTGIPATFIVDPSGAVVYRHIGAARWDADAVMTFLRGLASRSTS